MALTKRDIAEAALRMLDQVGLDGLSLRAIAEDLGVKAPALYWHLRNKQELLDEVATLMYLRHVQPLPPPVDVDDWPGRLALRARALREMMMAHRDGARVFSGTFFTDDSLPEESAVAEIVAAGHTPRQALRVLSAVFGFTVGLAIEQQAIEPLPGQRDGRYAKAAARRQVGSGLLMEVVDEAVNGDFDAQFEDGLEIVLLGAKAWLRQS